MPQIIVGQSKNKALKFKQWVNADFQNRIMLRQRFWEDTAKTLKYLEKFGTNCIAVVSMVLVGQPLVPE